MSTTQPEQFPRQASQLALDVEAFLRDLLVRTARPSAGELLRAIERDVSLDARGHFEAALKTLVEDKTLRRADKAYLEAMLADGSVAAALHGEGKADEETVSSIDALLRQTALYRSSTAFKEMVAFMGRFRDYAPYNVMLVRVQNPSCGFFATEKDWWKRHRRRLIDNAKPILILAPMHPVMLVYALEQTAGREVPKQLLEFAHFEGEWQAKWLANMVENAQRHRIGVAFKELSSTHAGRATNDPGIDGWKMRITVHDRLDKPSQFGVLVHELAHVLLGHLGTDYDHWWPGRFNVDTASAEIEAETVAHIVATRFGLQGSSAAYLSGYVADAAIPQGVSIDLIAKVAGEIERMAKGLLPAPKPRPPKSTKKP
jgi:hypothetical protein